METILGLTLFTLVFGLFIGALIGGLLLRAAIALANKVFKPERVQTRPKTPQPTSKPGSASRYESEPDFGSVADQMVEDIPAGVNPFAGSNNPVGSSSPSDDNPYSAPVSYDIPAATKLPILKPVIPVPSYVNACGIAFTQGFVSFVINTILGGVIAVAAIDIAPFLSIAIGFVVAIVVYGLKLPTTAGKAAAIYLFQILIVFGIAIVAGIAFAIIAAISG